MLRHGPTNEIGLISIHSAAVRQARIHHRRGLVAAPAERRDDPVDHPHDMLVVVKDHLALGQLAAALDKHLARAVDHDLADLGVVEQHFQRPEAQNIGRDALEHARPLAAGQHDIFTVQDRVKDILDLLAHLSCIGEIELRVQFADQPVLDSRGISTKLLSSCSREGAPCLPISARAGLPRGFAEPPSGAPGVVPPIRFSNDITRPPWPSDDVTRRV